jgi:hypothetical protein
MDVSPTRRVLLFVVVAVAAMACAAVSISCGDNSEGGGGDVTVSGERTDSDAGSSPDDPPDRAATRSGSDAKAVGVLADDPGVASVGEAIVGDAGERRAARAAVTAAYAILEGALGASEKLDAAGLCNLMATHARKEMIAYAADRTHVRDGWSCESATRLLVDRSKRVGGPARARGVEVVGINVQGNQATASVRLGKRRAISSIPLLKEGGQWKLGTTP